MSEIILTYPVDFKPPFVTQHFGERPEYYRQFGLKGHEGMDFRAPTGTPILAAAEGTVDIAAVGKQYGVQIWLRHALESDVYQTLYAHLQKFAPGIQRGKQVARGELIGYADNTGNSSAAHLHFGLRVNGKWIDPEPYIVYPK